MTNNEVSKLEESIDKKLQIEKERSEAIARELFKSVKSFKTTAKTYNPSKAKSKIINEEVCLMLSDFHLGYEYTMEETGFISEYNFEVFKKRLNHLKNSMTEKLDVHIQNYKNKVLNIFILGDIVAGTPLGGEWSSAYTSMPIYDQVMNGFKQLTDFIFYFSTMFDEIKVYCVKGNHGRTEKGKTEKDYCNWDNICYDFIGLRFKDIPNVNLVSLKSFFQIADVNGYKFILHHGDKLSGGTSLEKLEKAQLKISAIKREFYDYIICGHYHMAQDTSTILGKALINGSFIGGDIYSIQNFQVSIRPEQKMFGVNKKEGISWVYDMPLE